MLAKCGSLEATVTYAEAVEIALCWGWIDGQKKGLDNQHFLERLTPRRACSVWSKINVEKVAALIDAGRMKEAGFAQIEAAKAFFATVNAAIAMRCIGEADCRKARNTRQQHRPTGSDAGTRRGH